MIQTLAFSETRTAADGRPVQDATFGYRATVTPHDACAVANAICARLASLFDGSVESELIEPVPLCSSMAEALFSGARVYRSCGDRGDAFTVMRRPDQRILCAYAFGVAPQSRLADLSSLEARVVDRVAHAVALALTPLCGTVTRIVAEKEPALFREARSYFEVRLIRPTVARIGVAVAEPQHGAAGVSLTLSDLRDVPLTIRARMGDHRLPLSTFARLEAGTVAPLAAPFEGSCVLEADGTTIACGDVGIEGGSVAVRVRRPYLSPQ